MPSRLFQLIHRARSDLSLQQTTQLLTVQVIDFPLILIETIGVNFLSHVVSPVPSRPIPEGMPLRYYSTPIHSAAFVLPGN